MYSPISLIVPQYVDQNGDPYSGAVLKAYRNGTSTVISMATDSSGGTTFTSILLNSSGYPELSSNIVIPHVNEDYKLSLYPTQVDADSNTGAIFTIDNLTAIHGDTVVGLLNYTSDESGAVQRTVENRLYDLVSISDFGAVGDGLANDTAEIDAAPTNTYVPFGDWVHSDTAFVFDKILWGPGTVVTSEGLRRGHNVFRLTAAPTLSGGNNIAEFFDTMPTMFSYDISVTGAATAGEPVTGYTQTDEIHPVFYGAYYSSGHNESLTNADGRTGWAIQRARLEHDGLGDAFCQNYNVIVTNVDAAHTGIAGQTAGGLFNGQIAGAVNDCYLNLFELNMKNSTDGGITAYDINTSAVLNFKRYTPNQGAGNVDNFWNGIRFQSIGTQQCDSMLMAVGPTNGGWKWSLDHSGNVDRCDIALKAGDRIYFDATPQYDTTSGGSFALFAKSDGQKYVYLDAVNSRFTVKNMGIYSDASLMANLGVGILRQAQNVGDLSFEITDANTLTFNVKTALGVFKTATLTLS